MAKPSVQKIDAAKLNSELLGSRDDIAQVAQIYINLGWRLVRLNRRGKTPFTQAWQNANPKATDFRSGENIGVQLGTRSAGVVDLDFDTAWARRLSGLNCFFGRAPAFGRTSQPATEPGHRLVICPDAPNKIHKFAFGRAREKELVAQLGLEKSTILEVRDGAAQTAFPPSILGDDQLIWNREVRLPNGHGRNCRQPRSFWHSAL